MYLSYIPWDNPLELVQYHLRYQQLPGTTTPPIPPKQQSSYQPQSVTSEYVYVCVCGISHQFLIDVIHDLHVSGRGLRTIQPQCKDTEEVGKGYDDIQMSHDKYRLHDDILHILHSARDKIPNIFDILVRVT